MSPIRLLDYQTERVQTGPLQFEDDWPGVFIRGDEALGYAGMLKAMLDGTVDPVGLREGSRLHGLRDLLLSCSVNKK